MQKTCGKVELFMSNSRPQNPMPPKRPDGPNKYQSFLLVSSLVAALALVVVVFLNSTRPAGAQARINAQADTFAAAEVAQTRAVTGTNPLTDTIVMTGVTDMAGMDMTGMTMTDTTSGTMSGTVAGPNAITSMDVMTGSMNGDQLHAAHAMATAGATSSMTSTVSVTVTPPATRTTPLTTTAPATTSASAAVSPTLTTATAPAAGAANEEVQGLMQDVLLLVRSHNARMQKMLTGTPTGEEVAAMNADMQVLTRMMQRLIALTQGQSTAALFPQAALTVPNTTLPGMGTTGVMTATGVMTGMAGMDMSGMSSAPVTTMAPMTVPTGTMGMQLPGTAQPSVDQQLQTITVLMQESRQQMQAMMANGASAAELEQMRAKLERVRYLMRDVMAQIQAGAGPAPATLDSPIAGAASAATANSGMMGNMSAMMDNMSSMMSSMMGGMGGMSGGTTGGTSGATMPGATTAQGTVDPAIAALMRSAEAGGVTITVLPLNLSDPAASTLDFRVKVDTHTVALDQNLGSLSVLRASSGAWAPALQWNGPTGGHHVEGTLSFPRADKAGTALAMPGGTLTLSIRDFGGIADRSFTWDLGQ